MGISSVGIGFGLYALVIGLINLFVGLFCAEEFVRRNNNNRNNETISNNTNTVTA